MKELLDMDTDGSGKVSRKKADQDDIGSKFDHLDKDDSGELDHDDIEPLDSVPSV